MASWVCKLDLDVVKSAFSGASYEYKTRASQQRVIRNIRLMAELMGLVVDIRTKGRNEITVRSLALRQN